MTDNMLLKAFAERVKFTIEEQLGLVLAASTPLLKAKLTSKFTEVANDPSLLDLIMEDLEELEEKAVRKLFNRCELISPRLGPHLDTLLRRS